MQVLDIKKRDLNFHKSGLQLYAAKKETAFATDRQMDNSTFSLRDHPNKFQVNLDKICCYKKHLEYNAANLRTSKEFFISSTASHEVLLLTHNTPMHLS